MTDTKTVTLTEFLLARIAEDEAAAMKLRGTGFARWERVEYERSVGGRIPNVWEDWRPRAPEGGDPTGLGYVPLSEHLARHDPARVLRDVEAKRRIVETLTIDALGDERLDLDGNDWFVLASLAAVYADHPDYRDEWAV